MLARTARDQAIAVMDRLLKHPITLSFHEPPAVDGETDRSSSSVNPIGLLTVRDRLSNGHYATICDWITDVENVIHLYESESGNDFEFAAASEVRRVFTKERTKMRITTASFWARSVADLKSRLSILSTSVPSRIRSQMVPIPPVDIPTPQEFPLTEHEIQETLNGTEAFTIDQMDRLATTVRGGSAEKRSETVRSASIDGSNAMKIREYVLGCVRDKRE